MHDYDRRSVHEIAQVIRELNGLTEKELSVRYASYHEMVYAGDLEKLKLPEGYYCDEYEHRGVKYPCITNKLNATNGTYRIFVVRKT